MWDVRRAQKHFSKWKILTNPTVRKRLSQNIKCNCTRLIKHPTSALTVRIFINSCNLITDPWVPSRRTARIWPSSVSAHSCLWCPNGSWASSWRLAVQNLSNGYFVPESLQQRKKSGYCNFSHWLQSHRSLEIFKSAINVMCCHNESYCLTLENGIDRMLRNVGNELNIHAP